MIVNKFNYTDYPHFDESNREYGYNEVYNYAYESEYPVVDYSRLYFDVDVITTAKYYENGITGGNDDDDRELMFYNIGEYRMVSGLQFYSAKLLDWVREHYTDEELVRLDAELAAKEKDLKDLKDNYTDGKVTEEMYERLKAEIEDEIKEFNLTNSVRGVRFDGTIALKNYTKYVSTLKIRGFQAEYGGQHEDSKYSGPLPFYDSTNSSLSSDISQWVRDQNMTAEKKIGSVADYNNMRVSDTKKYSNDLANYITTTNTIQPVRTNFPPVKIKGNISHITTNDDEKTVLSTVAYCPAYGAGNAAEWNTSTLEVGAPFEDAGKYLVIIYFKINGVIYQQTFYFEIVNTVKIAFEVTDPDDSTNTYYADAGDLELDQELQNLYLAGWKVRLLYDGEMTLGQFEVLPTITLSYAAFENYNYENCNDFKMAEDGSFAFELKKGKYQLTIQYGAHGKSVTIFSIVVDNESATGITAQTQANTLKNLPDNVAVVGAGDVALTWDQKPSGINYRTVQCEFYEMAVSTSSDPNANSNYTNFPNSNFDLYTAFNFSNTLSNTGSYHPIKTTNGWTLAETFKEAGLYRFTFVDDVGNKTPYVLIIDDTKPTFIQDKQADMTANMVNYGTDGVKVGFGNNKLIKIANADAVNGSLHQNIFTDLNNNGVYIKNGVRAIKIPLMRVEMSESGELYKEIDINNGYVVLKDEVNKSAEGTYYFRVTDVLGNVGEYYIILTHDSCFGTVYAEDGKDSDSIKLSTTNDHGGRGMIDAEPTFNTSLVNTAGGMTNRKYISFAFKQNVNGNDKCRVSQVVMHYYPLNYQLTATNDATVKNPNYPFSDQPKDITCHVDDDWNKPLVFGNAKANGVIYTWDGDKDEEVGATIRLALFNTGTETPSGLYILTRIYFSPDSNDPTARDYYFIVDNQKMLYYADNYKTALKIHFAEQESNQEPKAKVADADYINDVVTKKKELSSNRYAWIEGFNSKYSYGHDSVAYTIDLSRENEYPGSALGSTQSFTFPSLSPRFNLIHGNQVMELGEGNGKWPVYNPESRSNDTTYQLIIADDARNISCILKDGNIFELKDDTDAPTSANYNIIAIDLDIGYGTRAEIVVGENQIISNSRMDYDDNGYWCVLDPYDIEQLQFRFENTDGTMYMGINLEATTATWTWTSNGISNPITLAAPSLIDGVYTYDLMRDFLDGTIVNNGDSLSLSIVTEDDVRTSYTILFDRYKPKYNENRVKANDNLAATMNASELPKGYIYGLSTDFVFETDRVNNPYLDTKIITYREVDAIIDGSQAAVPFKLYTGAVNETPIPFATLVGLRNNEMKYYVITEEDYAGHRNSYTVQIQGADYNNAIDFIGADNTVNKGLEIGVEMHASTSSVHQFFSRNNSFKFVSGDDYYIVLGGEAEWHIGDNIGSSTDKNNGEKELVNALNNWINAATEKGEKCSYVLYDRIGEPESFEFYNLREGAAKIQLDCNQASATSNVINLKVTNLDDLPRIMFDSDLTKLFNIVIEDRTTNESITYNEYNDYLLKSSGTPIYIDVTHELVIKVRDPFGRTSVTEYHQQSKVTRQFTVYGNTVVRDGAIYVGDARGVDFSYLRTVYSVLIYDETSGTGTKPQLQSYVNNDMVYYNFKPSNENSIQYYHIIATGKASGAILFEQVFAFDTRLPDYKWTVSDQEVNVEGQSFISSVTLNLIEDDTIFPASVSYTRTVDNQVESVTLPSSAKKITFYKDGVYKVILRNTIWTEKVFEFEIVQVNDELVLVYDNGVKLDASTSDYDYNGIKIPRYIFTMKINQQKDTYYPIEQYRDHRLTIERGHTNRVLAGNNGADYYEYVSTNNENTLIWRLAYAVGDEYVNPIYFATTGVLANSLNDLNANNLDPDKITLLLNGNPNNPAGNSTSYKVPLNSTYNMIYNNFMTPARGKKLTVQLYYDDATVDAAGAPCYFAQGNLILVDCYYNGTLVKTLNYNDVFTINQNAAGYYEFAVHDLAGNYLYFGSSFVDKDDINYTRNRYMLAVMTKPVILINDKLPVSGMIYNDQVELKVDDYASDFLVKYYQSLVNNNTIANDNNFFKKYFCITSLEITHNGKTEVQNIDDGQSVFYWNQTGDYHVLLTYRIHGVGTISSYLSAEYSFKITPSRTVREEFSMPIFPNVPVIGVQRDGYNIYDYSIFTIRDSNNDAYMKFDANNNPGSYVVTLQTYNEILQDNITYEVRFNIQHKTNSASTYFILSSASGSSAKGAVTLYYNPYLLYLAQGNVTITLYKDFVAQQVITVNKSVLNSDSYNSQELFNVADAGIYSVSVKDADNDLVFSDSWTIEKEQSTTGYIILAVVLGIAGIALLVFIRLRRKMTTK